MRSCEFEIQNTAKNRFAKFKTPWERLLFIVKTKGQIVDYLNKYIIELVYWTDLIETRNTAQDAAIYVEIGNEMEYSRMIVDLLDDPERQRRMGKFGRQRFLNHLSWEHQKDNLIQAYSIVMDGKVWSMKPVIRIISFKIDSWHRGFILSNL